MGRTWNVRLPISHSWETNLLCFWEILCEILQSLSWWWWWWCQWRQWWLHWWWYDDDNDGDDHDVQVHQTCNKELERFWVGFKHPKDRNQSNLDYSVLEVVFSLEKVSQNKNIIITITLIKQCFLLWFSKFTKEKFKCLFSQYFEFAR